MSALQILCNLQDSKSQEIYNELCTGKVSSCKYRVNVCHLLVCYVVIEAFLPSLTVKVEA